MSIPFHIHVISKIMSYLQDERWKLFKASCVQFPDRSFAVVRHMSFKIYFVLLHSLFEPNFLSLDSFLFSRYPPLPQNFFPSLKIKKITSIPIAKNSKASKP